jgi:hypothetical protein
MDVYLHSETALLVNFPLAQVNALHTHPASMPKTLVEPYTGIRSAAQKIQEKKRTPFQLSRVENGMADKQGFVRAKSASSATTFA